MMVEWGRGESRVNVAVEVMRWNVASSMNLGALGSRSSSSSGGSRFGLSGGVSLGVGMVMEREERAWPRLGWWGIVPAWVARVRDVLNPARVSCGMKGRQGVESRSADQIYTARGALSLGLLPFVHLGLEDPKELRRECCDSAQVRRRHFERSHGQLRCHCSAF